MNKKELGQFYTTNYEYILKGMFIPENITNIIEPFTGQGDLIKFIKNPDKYKIECYDIDPKNTFTVKLDTLLDPPLYENKFLITNPPYLARNKTKNKTLFDKYDVNDLFKCVIKELITNKCIGGILIIPLNFWSSIRKSDIILRKSFLEVYDIILLNIFEESVFEDTSYSVCSFQFQLKQKEKNIFNLITYPSNNIIEIELNENNNFTIGGEIYNLEIKNNYKITRLTKKNIKKKNTKILVKCIDDNIDNMISLSYEEDEKNCYVDNTPNLSSRTYCTLIIEPSIDIETQNKLVLKFNKFLNEYRKKYNSLFLTNYRESKNIARKRISFDLVYLISGYVLENLNDL